MKDASQFVGVGWPSICTRMNYVFTCFIRDFVRPVTSPPLSLLFEQHDVERGAVAVLWQKTKFLTWSMQAVVASKNPRKPWQKNCTVLLDHCDTAPTVSLLRLESSQVHRDSQSTGARRKELLCTWEKCHFTVIKCQYVLRAALSWKWSLTVCALNAHLHHRTAPTIPGTGNANLFQVETEMNTVNVKAVMT